MQVKASDGIGGEFHTRVAPAGMVQEPAVLIAAVPPKRHAIVADVLSFEIAIS